MCATALLCGASLLPAAWPALAQEGVRQAGTDVPPPKRTKFVSPVYPPEAQAAGQRGIVILEIVVGVSGQVESVNVVRSVPPFDEAATSAVRQWAYEVTRVDGKAVPVRLTVPITFALRLPQMTRASGVPEMRLGAAPALPAEPWSRRDATVIAEVTLDAEGQVADALVTAGESPWAESFLQAVRSWRFVVNPSDPPVAFRVSAHFFAKEKEPSRVDLELSHPRAVAADAAPRRRLRTQPRRFPRPLLRHRLRPRLRHRSRPRRSRRVRRTPALSEPGRPRPPWRWFRAPPRRPLRPRAAVDRRCRASAWVREYPTSRPAGGRSCRPSLDCAR